MNDRPLSAEKMTLGEAFAWRRWRLLNFPDTSSWAAMYHLDIYHWNTRHG